MDKKLQTYLKQQCTQAERGLAVSIYGWMLRNVDDYIDSYTGEVNVTQLSEACAEDLDHDEWLDDSTHIVWDLAVVVSERVEKERI